MEKKKLNEALLRSHADFVAVLNNLTPQQFDFFPVDKWNAGQHLDHIFRSVNGVSFALLIPKFLLKKFFGINNRIGKTPEELIEKYKAKIAFGGKATGRFVPKKLYHSSITKDINKLNKSIDKLIKRISKFTEQELDTLLLPHPLLGKLTLREMIYFTIYHATHHLQLIKRDLKID